MGPECRCPSRPLPWNRQAAASPAPTPRPGGGQCSRDTHGATSCNRALQDRGLTSARPVRTGSPKRPPSPRQGHPLSRWSRRRVSGASAVGGSSSEASRPVPGAAPAQTGGRPRPGSRQAASRPRDGLSQVQTGPPGHVMGGLPPVAAGRASRDMSLDHSGIPSRIFAIHHRGLLATYGSGGVLPQHGDKVIPRPCHPGPDRAHRAAADLGSFRIWHAEHLRQHERRLPVRVQSPEHGGQHGLVGRVGHDLAGRNTRQVIRGLPPLPRSQFVQTDVAGDRQDPCQSGGIATEPGSARMQRTT
jgi:hypothetical protein